jgi:hypothetical protein
MGLKSTFFLYVVQVPEEASKIHCAVLAMSRGQNGMKRDINNEQKNEAEKTGAPLEQTPVLRFGNNRPSQGRHSGIDTL